MNQIASMRTFVRLAELQSFTRTADSLGLSRSVVSAHLADLERHLGTRLVNRTTRRVGITADGAEYLEHCRRILADLDAADDALRGNRERPQGRLRVDVPELFGKYLLVPALPRFTSRYPSLQLEVQFNDRVIDLIEEQVDVAVRGGGVSAPNLIARRVVRTRLITCASPEYLKQHGVPGDPQQLRGHKLIGALSNATRRPQKWVFQKGQIRKQLPFRFNVAFNSVEARTQAAVRGAGIVQTMDLLVAELLAENRLQAVLTEWSAEGAPISIVYPATHRQSPKVRVFAAFAAQLLEDYRVHVDRLLALRA
jgi:LysR family transcriptional regulator, regulator for bpeEF and oprC